MEAGSYLHQRRYRIRQPLGRGGMGAVYLAEDLNLAGRLVAVKENLNNSEEAQRQFRREAVLLAHLRHPGLPQVIDYFLDERGRQYLVMEYVPGENMQEALTSKGALPIAEALTCMDQVLQAVAYMHHQRDPATGRSRAIIHRDIKPANIKRTPEGRYVLVDFGIAKVQSTTAATVLGARALTPGYAPIEQYHGGTDERSDVYALGATLYALVTGKAPPSATNMASGAPLPPPRSYNSKIPASVSKVIERAMRMAAPERYQQVTEMYAALFNRAMPTGPITSHAPVAQPRSRHPALSTTLVVGGIAVVTVLAFWWLLANSGTAAVVMQAPLAPPGSASAPVTTPPMSITTIAAVVAAAATATPPLQQTAGAATAAPDLPPPTPEFAPSATDTPAATATSAQPAAAPTATSTASMDEVSLLVSAATRAPAIATATATATAASVNSASAVARMTSTPLPTATALSTVTRPAATTARPANAANANVGSRGAGAGPTTARILAPADQTAVNVPLRFAWEPDRPLAPGQEYEVVFWRTTESETAGRGWVRSGVATSVVIDPLDAPVPETVYRWAVYLVTAQPYTRLRRLSEIRTFTAGALSPYEDLDDGGRG